MVAILVAFPVVASARMRGGALIALGCGLIAAGLMVAYSRRVPARGAPSAAIAITKGLLDQKSRQVAEGAPFLVAASNQLLIDAIGDGDGNPARCSEG